MRFRPCKCTANAQGVHLKVVFYMQRVAFPRKRGMFAVYQPEHSQYIYEGGTSSIVKNVIFIDQRQPTQQVDLWRWL
jgi:hypothetical protein